MELNYFVPLLLLHVYASDSINWISHILPEYHYLGTASQSEHYLIFSGSYSDSKLTSISTTAEIYNTDTNSWATLTLPVKVAQYSVTTAANITMMVGGVNSTGQVQVGTLIQTHH